MRRTPLRSLLSHTALIVRVPQGEALVGDLRARFDASAALGVPAHITVLFPFMAVECIDTDVLRGIRTALDGVPAFNFVLAGVARFAATAYIKPDPAEPFIDLTERLVRRFPDFPPFGGEFETIMPHLTAAHGDAAQADLAHAELLRRMAAGGTVRGRCDAVVLLENSSGPWREMHAFSLTTAGPAV